MKCPVCSEKNMKSSIYVGMSTSTLMYCTPYYDEDGNYHSHDSNTHSTSYSCTKGHQWSESSTGTCPSCDFGKDSKCVTIHNSEEVSPVVPGASIVGGGNTIFGVENTISLKKSN